MVFRSRVVGPTFLIFACCLFSMFSGCEEDVVLVSGIDQPFTLFGVLTPQSDTQRVVVFSIDDNLQPVLPDPLDARVQSTDLQNALLEIWNDEVVQDSAGMYAHVYWSPFTPNFGHTYRMDIERSDGALSFVEVTVPPVTTLSLPPQQMDMPSIFPIFIVGAAPKLIKIEVTYRVKFITASTIVEEEFLVLYDGKEQKTDLGWLINVNVANDMRALKALLLQRLVITLNTELKPIELKIQLIVANKEWDPPGGVFDPEVLVQPGLLSNVENGFGFLGAGYQLSGKWAPLDSIIVALSPSPNLQAH